MILITGGGGYLGLNISLSLTRAGQDVLLVQRHAQQRSAWLAEFWDKHIRQANGSVLDLPFLLGAIKDYGVESIIHGAFDTKAIRNAASLKS